MISLEKRMILTPLQKLPNNVSYCGKKTAAKKQKIPQSGHTAADVLSFIHSLPSYKFNSFLQLLQKFGQIQVSTKLHIK